MNVNQVSMLKMTVHAGSHECIFLLKFHCQLESIEMSLPFSKVQHKVTTLDAQPSSPTVASLIVSVTGLLVVDDSTNALQFSQIFQLIPDGSSYYVYNDIFRLNYG
ncbi:Nuclear transport factor 2 [Termitomyces sp. J132]|nr:Nuclear transport factor 2 [Termitomyces sp. J132]